MMACDQEFPACVSVVFSYVKSPFQVGQTVCIKFKHTYMYHKLLFYVVDVHVEVV